MSADSTREAGAGATSSMIDQIINWDPSATARTTRLAIATSCG